MRLSFCDVRRSWEPHRQRRQSRPDVLPCRQARAIRRCGVAVARQHRARDIFWQWHRRTGLSTWVHSWHTIFAPALSRRTRAAPGCTRAGGHGEGKKAGPRAGQNEHESRTPSRPAGSGAARRTPGVAREPRATRQACFRARRARTHTVKASLLAGRYGIFTPRSFCPSLQTAVQSDAQMDSFAPMALTFGVANHGTTQPCADLTVGKYYLP